MQTCGGARWLRGAVAGLWAAAGLMAGCGGSTGDDHVKEVRAAALSWSRTHIGGEPEWLKVYSGWTSCGGATLERDGREHSLLVAREGDNPWVAREVLDGLVVDRDEVMTEAQCLAEFRRRG